LSSSENPQFEPPPVSAERPTLSTPDPFAAASIAPVPTAPPPIENPVWNGWDVLLIAGLTVVTMVVFQLAVLLAAHFLWYPKDSLADVSRKPILLIVSQFLIYIPVALCMIALVEGKYHVGFWRAIQWNWPRGEWKLVALGGATFFVLGLLQNLLPIPKDTPFEHLFDRPRDAYLLSLIAVTLGPLMEELFFRGFMYPVLAWGAALVIFLVGVVCGMVRAVTRSVGASFLVHAGFNGTQMLIAVVMTQGFRHMPKALAQLSLL
jgi:membrane protease YdiL (CAAX protease family)